MVKIFELQRADYVPLKKYCENAVAKDYYSDSELDQFCTNGASFAAGAGGRIQGVRLTLRPGSWLAKYKYKRLYRDRWEVAPERMALFQSAWLDPELRGQGLGPKMGTLAIDALKKDSGGILVHAWKDSPRNGAVNYLTKLGFKILGEQPLFWEDVDHFCHACSKPKCICTAIEMIYRF